MRVQYIHEIISLFVHLSKWCLSVVVILSKIRSNCMTKFTYTTHFPATIVLTGYLTRIGENILTWEKIALSKK